MCCKYTQLNQRDKHAASTTAVFSEVAVHWALRATVDYAAICTGCSINEDSYRKDKVLTEVNC